MVPAHSRTSRTLRTHGHPHAPTHQTQVFCTVFDEIKTSFTTRAAMWAASPYQVGLACPPRRSATCHSRSMESFLHAVSTRAADASCSSDATQSDQNKKSAATIASYLQCMRAKLRTAGRGTQNAEMLLCSRVSGVLSIEDYGGWAQRNESMTRLLHELDDAGRLPDFAPVLMQTGDRCIARRAAEGTELHLWQRQPVPAELLARLPLHRVVSMCSSPKYADVPVPDWCFDMWPEAGVPRGEYDAACAELTTAGAAPPSDGNLLSWCGTAHHHPSRMRLVHLADDHPGRLAVNYVVDRPKDGGGDGGRPQHRSLLEQVARCGYLLDVQGKGYSSRLKLLLHSGRLVFIVARPWQEHFHSGLVPVRQRAAHFPPASASTWRACVPPRLTC